MAIGKNSWKGAKEKAKNKSNNLDRQKKLHPYLYKDETKDNKSYSYTATSHRIPVKEANEITPKGIKMNKTKGMPLNSPMEGNAFGKAMADAGGDYEKAKAMLDNDVATMKAEYGTGSAMMYKSKSVLVGTLGDDIKKDQESQVQPSGTIQRQRFKSIKDRVKRDQQQK